MINISERNVLLVSVSCSPVTNVTRHNSPLLVFNVSVSPQQKKQTFELRRLSPGQDYEVRIRAVTPAGPGANETAKFKTNHHEPFGIIWCNVTMCFLVGCDERSRSLMMSVWFNHTPRTIRLSLTCLFFFSEHIIALVLGAVLLVFICILFVFCRWDNRLKAFWCSHHLFLSVFLSVVNTFWKRNALNNPFLSNDNWYHWKFINQETILFQYFYSAVNLHSAKMKRIFKRNSLHCLMKCGCECYTLLHCYTQENHINAHIFF